jgi:hypothetical protein
MNFDWNPIRIDRAPSDATHAVYGLLVAKDHFRAAACTSMFEGCDEEAKWRHCFGFDFFDA